jgi:hypothetical protein
MAVGETGAGATAAQATIETAVPGKLEAAVAP